MKYKRRNQRKQDRQKETCQDRFIGNTVVSLCWKFYWLFLWEIYPTPCKGNVRSTRQGNPAFQTLETKQNLPVVLLFKMSCFSLLSKKDFPLKGTGNSSPPLPCDSSGKSYKPLVGSWQLCDWSAISIWELERKSVIWYVSLHL